MKQRQTFSKVSCLVLVCALTMNIANAGFFNEFFSKEEQAVSQPTTK